MNGSRSAVALAVLAVVFAFGCNKAKNEAPAPASQAQPGAPMAQAGGAPLSGKVVETMNSGNYTYVCLENNGKKTWFAMPETTVKVGQQVTCRPGGEMKNFTSKTLKRTFESIIFTDGLQ